MAHTRRPQHPNAALTPVQRLKMVRLVHAADIALVGQDSMALLTLLSAPSPASVTSTWHSPSSETLNTSGASISHVPLPMH